MCPCSVAARFTPPRAELRRCFLSRFRFPSRLRPPPPPPALSTGPLGAGPLGRGSGRAPGSGQADQLEQCGHAAMALHRVPQRLIRSHAVDVATTLPRVREEALLLELGDDPLDAPLRDPHALGEIPDARVRILHDADEHVGVVREERPGGRRRDRPLAGSGRSRSSSSRVCHDLTLADTRITVRVSECVSYCTHVPELAPPQMQGGRGRKPQPRAAPHER